MEEIQKFEQIREVYVWRKSESYKYLKIFTFLPDLSWSINFGDLAYFFLTRIYSTYRRYVILIKSHLLTFKDNMNRDAPTEIIPINNCCTVKSADDELNQKNSFKVLV